MLRLPLPALAALLVISACDATSGEEQRLFENQALLSPVSGITRTEADATVLSTDPSDWRIGPAYLNRVALLELPSPNPVRFGEAVRLLVDSQGTPGGLRIGLLREDPDTGVLDVVSIRDPNAVRDDATQPGFYTFSVSASQIGLGGPGLYRLVLLTGGNGIVSYGDVEVLR